LGLDAGNNLIRFRFGDLGEGKDGVAALSSGFSAAPGWSRRRASRNR